MKRSAFHKVGNSEKTSARSVRHKKSLMVAFLSCLGMLLAFLITGCEQQRPAQAKAKATPTARPAPTASGPTAVPPDARARTLIVDLGCVGCHTIDRYTEARGTVGPDLSHIFTQAPEIIASAEYKKSSGKATTAREYLSESILSPSAFVFATCPLGTCPDFVMPRDFKTRIKPDELEAILDLLSTFN